MVNILFSRSTAVYFVTFRVFLFYWKDTIHKYTTKGKEIFEHLRLKLLNNILQFRKFDYTIRMKNGEVDTGNPAKWPTFGKENWF